MKKLLLGFLSLVIIFSFERMVKAEVYGNISGKVIDNVTKKGVGKVILDIYGGNVSEITYTDKEGNYVFNNVPVGNYRLKINPYYYANYNVEKEIVEISLKQGTNVTDLNFNVEKLGSISGKLNRLNTTYIGEQYIVNKIYAYNSTNSLYIGGNKAVVGGEDFKIGGLRSALDWNLLYVCGISGSSTVYKYSSLIDINNSENIQNVQFNVGAID